MLFSFQQTTDQTLSTDKRLSALGKDRDMFTLAGNERFTLGMSERGERQMPLILKNLKRGATTAIVLHFCQVC